MITSRTNLVQLADNMIIHYSPPPKTLISLKSFPYFSKSNKLNCLFCRKPARFQKLDYRNPKDRRAIQTILQHPQKSLSSQLRELNRQIKFLKKEVDFWRGKARSYQKLISYWASSHKLGEADVPPKIILPNDILIWEELGGKKMRRVRKMKEMAKDFDFFGEFVNRKPLK